MYEPVTLFGMFPEGALVYVTANWLIAHLNGAVKEDGEDEPTAGMKLIVRVDWLLLLLP